MFLYKSVLCGWLLLASQLATAQTNWPSYISQLEHDISESTVAAVLPADTAIQTPASDVANSKARFSGLWSGWGCQARICDVKLAVEKITETGATVVYAGASDSGQLNERVQAVFSGDELQALLSTGTVLSFRFRPGSDLLEFVGNNKGAVRIAGMLSQTAAAAKLGAVAPAPPLAKITDRIPTPFIESGKPVTLEVVIYKPQGTGPFPALMFNHGSTGSGDNPATFVSTYTSAALAKFFTDKGFLVAFPQRRGRGKSGGLYDEGFEKDRSRYSCDPQLSLPGLDRALTDMDAAADYLAARPDVDSKRMLIGGVSRGGIAASVYAGMRPTRFMGVINFVGGWISDYCASAEAINTVSFRRAAGFGEPMLWLYGQNDPFYKISHSKKNFDAFIAAGGKGVFKVIDPGPGQDGHGISAMPHLWRGDMNDYLMQLRLPQSK